LAFKWLGQAPVSIDTTTQAWQSAMMWEVVSGFTQVAPLTQDTEALRITTDQQSYRDNRASHDQWQWLKLGAANTISGTQTTLRIFQASAGYKIDKIVFSDNASASSFLQSQNGGKGPLATNGSATRESCNVCNPAYGLTKDQSQCGCPANATEAAAYVGGLGSPPTAPPYGSGQNCTVVAGTVDEPTNNLENDLFSGIQPLRAAQEAVKDFAKRLDTDFDQIGLIDFGDTVVNDADRRTQLQCQRSDPNNCANDANRFPKFLQAAEQQWPSGTTNISQGLKEGLATLGVAPYATDNDCTPGNFSSACARPGARKILILVTDGSPNTRDTTCPAHAAMDSLWNGLLSPNDENFECAVYFGKQAADSGVIIYTIGIGAGVNPDFLTAIAEGRDPHGIEQGIGPEQTLFSARGGRFDFASNPDDLERIFTEILGNIYVRIR
jgi:hypothetical protein